MDTSISELAPTLQRLRDAWQANKPDETQRRRQLFRILELRRLAKIHRPAVVDQQVEVQVLFFEEQFQEELFESREEIPIDEAEIVPGYIGAEVGKLDALSLPPALPLTLHSSAENLPADELEAFELGQ